MSPLYFVKRMKREDVPLVSFFFFIHVLNKSLKFIFASNEFKKPEKYIMKTYLSALFHILPNKIYSNVTCPPQKLGSRVRAGTVLISPCFLKVQMVITRLTITDSLSLGLRKLVYCRLQSLMKMLAIGMANYIIHLLLYPQLIAITSIPY